MTESDPIIVWEYSTAPKDLQIKLGGDESWIAEIPPRFNGSYIPWIDDCSGFGACETRNFDHPTKPGWKLRIGCHA